jgi:hypothetical protein
VRHFTSRFLEHRGFWQDGLTQLPSKQLQTVFITNPNNLIASSINVTDKRCCREFCNWISAQSINSPRQLLDFSTRSAICAQYMRASSRWCTTCSRTSKSRSSSSGLNKSRSFSLDKSPSTRRPASVMTWLNCFSPRETVVTTQKRQC